MVDQDRSMEAMIENDEEKVWMTPLLDLRNELGDFSLDRARRDYRRMDGRVQLFSDNRLIIRGPYVSMARALAPSRLGGAGCRPAALAPGRAGPGIDLPGRTPGDPPPLALRETPV